MSRTEWVAGRFSLSVRLIAGNPCEHSRSSALLNEVARRLHDQVDDRRLRVERLQIRDLSPQALLLADWGNRSVVRAIEQIAVGLQQPSRALGTLAGDLGLGMFHLLRLTGLGRLLEQAGLARPVFLICSEKDQATYDALNFRDDQFDLSDALIAIVISLLAVASLTQLWWLFGVSLVPAGFGILMGLAGLVGLGMHPDVLIKLLR